MCIHLFLYLIFVHIFGFTVAVTTIILVYYLKKKKSLKKLKTRVIEKN